MEVCNHSEIVKPEKKAIFERNAKILHKVYSKVLTHIKTTDGELCHENMNFTIQIVMRELNKAGGLYGFEKKEICLQVLILLLDSIGLPHIISYYTAECIEELIETIYKSGFHRFKKIRKCIIV